MQYGTSAFTTTGTTKEVTLIAACSGKVRSAAALPFTYTNSETNGGHVMFCDLVITSGAVTFARKVSVDSDAKFSYWMIYEG